MKHNPYCPSSPKGVHITHVDRSFVERCYYCSYTRYHLARDQEQVHHYDDPLYRAAERSLAAAMATQRSLIAKEW